MAAQVHLASVSLEEAPRPQGGPEGLMAAQVHLASLSLEGVKAFAEPVEIELAPLALVLGRSNTGKSALCRDDPELATSPERIRALRGIRALPVRGYLKQAAARGRTASCGTP